MFEGNRAGTAQVARGRSIVLLSALVLSACLGGCPPFGGGITAGDTATGLGSWLDMLPTPTEVAEYERQWEDFNSQLQDLPKVSVKIVNNTSAMVSVALSGGVPEPEYPMMDAVPYAGVAEMPYLWSVDDMRVLVAADGTATGEISCAEVIGMSILAPADGQFADHYNYSSDTGGYGLYIMPGNVILNGVGNAGSGQFKGDALDTAWYVRPGEDDLDCETQTLVITIETTASQNVFDPDTGLLVQGATLGTATVSVE